MHTLAKVALSTATVALVVLNGGAATASGGSTPSGSWPTAYPLPTDPGTVLSQSSDRATVRSTDTVATVKSKLDNLYVTTKGCTLKLTVNKPKDYFCTNPATGKTEEIYFTFAALDVTASNPYRSQSNAFYVKG
jgi:hypothetical protein